MILITGEWSTRYWTTLFTRWTKCGLCCRGCIEWSINSEMVEKVFTEVNSGLSQQPTLLLMLQKTRGKNWFCHKRNWTENVAKASEVDLLGLSRQTMSLMERNPSDKSGKSMTYLIRKQSTGVPANGWGTCWKLHVTALYHPHCLGLWKLWKNFVSTMQNLAKPIKRSCSQRPTRPSNLDTYLAGVYDSLDW